MLEQIIEVKVFLMVEGHEMSIYAVTLLWDFIHGKSKTLQERI